MTQRLPELFLCNNSMFTQPLIKKKQGKFFQLNLNHNRELNMSSTFTQRFRYKNNKTSLDKRSNLNQKSLYRTLPLKANKYEVSKSRRMLNSQISTIRSVKIKSFSLEGNPELCNSWHDNKVVENVNSIIEHKNNEVMQLELKLKPFKFVENEFRQDLQRIKGKALKQIEEVQNDFWLAIGNLKNQLSHLRRQTKDEIKRNKFDLQKYEEELKNVKEIADDFPQIMNKLKDQI